MSTQFVGRTGLGFLQKEAANDFDGLHASRRLMLVGSVEGPSLEEHEQLSLRARDKFCTNPQV